MVKVVLQRCDYIWLDLSRDCLNEIPSRWDYVWRNNSVSYVCFNGNSIKISHEIGCCYSNHLLWGEVIVLNYSGGYCWGIIGFICNFGPMMISLNLSYFGSMGYTLISLQSDSHFLLRVLYATLEYVSTHHLCPCSL